MGLKNDSRAGWNLIEFINEYGAHPPQARHDMIVMNNFMAHVDWGSKLVESTLNDLNRTIDASAKSARLCQHDLHHRTPITRACRRNR